MNIVKSCLFCGKYFFKRQNESRKDWETRHKYCSYKCAAEAKRGITAWNKGIKTGIRTAGCFKKGNEPWNKNKKIEQTIGNKNGKWKGENACYFAIHAWVGRVKGKPEKCIDCGRTRKETRMEWSNIDHQYRRNVNDYVPRCSKCHKKYDRENLSSIINFKLLESKNV
jgi:predicted Fe-S protein YdhL (DUF1289 family)